MRTKLKNVGVLLKSKPAIFTVVLWFVFLLYWETVIHLVTFGKFHFRYLYAVGFSVLVAMVLSLFCTMFPRKVNRIIFTCLTIVLFVLFASQMVYYRIFGSLYSVSMIEMGGKAVTSFWKETMSSIVQNILLLLAMALPVVAAFLVRRLNRNAFEPVSIKSGLAMFGAAAGLHLVMLLTLFLGGTGFYTPYDYYWGDDVTTDQSAECFGLMTTARLELQHMVFGGDAKEEDLSLLDDKLAIEGSGSTEPEEEPAPEVDTSPNIDPTLDFEALNQLTDDPAYRTLNDYFAQQDGSNKNEYTGMFEGYNLIMICAESFSPALISEELTPTLYKLSHEGFVFNNYYNSFPNVTTNGEFAFCTGLFPDLGRSKSNASFYASRNSYLPYCMGNLFSSQLGIQAWGYHNYEGSYYHRDETHPNMGYKFISASNGMTFTTDWPASDLEMFEQSVDDWINEDQFHAYYMTFSGHYKYDLDNPMCERNYHLVEDLDYSEAVKCYLSCNLELEKAMTYLLNRLQAAGVADRTVIVLTGDHFPYGLINSQYSELVGYEIDSFSKYKGTFICWNGGMEEPIEVDEYCCNIDILPTLMNLFGFEFDSRLVMGTDVLSDSRHMAILTNQSFLTDEVWFDSSTGEAIWQDGAVEDEEYLDSLINYVKNKFTISTAILNTSYYDFVFHHEFVTVDPDGNVTTEPAVPVMPDGNTVPPDEEGETPTTGGAVLPEEDEQADTTENTGG